MKLTILIFLGAFAWVGQILGAESVPPPAAASAVSPTVIDEKPALPALSSKGLSRVRQNLRAVTDNLNESKRNLDASAKNLSVIEGEMKDLEKLQKEQSELRTKYDEYLSRAEKEMAENDEAARRVENRLKTMGPQANPEFKTTLKNQSAEVPERDKLVREKLDREAWKSDAATKTKKIQELKAKLVLVYKDIESRREPLRAQLQVWTARTADYRKLVKGLEQKRSDLEKLAKNN